MSITSQATDYEKLVALRDIIKFTAELVPTMPPIKPITQVSIKYVAQYTLEQLVARLQEIVDPTAVDISDLAHIFIAMNKLDIDYKRYKSIQFCYNKVRVLWCDIDNEYNENGYHITIDINKYYKKLRELRNEQIKLNCYRVMACGFIMVCTYYTITSCFDPFIPKTLTYKLLE
jgi:hypothetical protein